MIADILYLNRAHTNPVYYPPIRTNEPTLAFSIPVSVTVLFLYAATVPISLNIRENCRSKAIYSNYYLNSSEAADVPFLQSSRG